MERICMEWSEYACTKREMTHGRDYTAFEFVLGIISARNNKYSRLVCVVAIGGGGGGGGGCDVQYGEIRNHKSKQTHKVFSYFICD